MAVCCVKWWVLWMFKTSSYISTSTRVVESIPLVDTKNTTTPPESFVRTAIEDLFDAHLTKRRGTHDTRFDSDVKCSLCERVRSAGEKSRRRQRRVGKDSINSLKLGMSSGLYRS